MATIAERDDPAPAVGRYGLKGVVGTDPAGRVSPVVVSGDSRTTGKRRAIYVVVALLIAESAAPTGELARTSIESRLA